MKMFKQPIVHVAQWSARFFTPLLLVGLLLLAAPTVAVFYATAEHSLGLGESFFCFLTTLSLFGLLFKPVTQLADSYAKSFAWRLKAHQLRAWDAPSMANYADQKAKQAETYALTSMAVLLGIYFTTCPMPVDGQAIHQREHEQPKQQAAHDTCLAQARSLQKELHLNEFGTVRALKYLRQGYGEQHVRNLFAATVRK